jgi:two-component system response regulator MprA
MSGAPPARVAKAIVVDDDERLLRVLKRGLRVHGFDVETFADAQDALAYMETRSADVAVLDVTMPDLDGVTLCRHLRRTNDMPILMLSARDTVPDRILGLESGADDYLTKPFELAELAARMRALLRRTERAGTATDVLTYADVSLDARRHEVSRGGRAIDLTPTEYRLLELFMRNPETLLNREQVTLQVWGYDSGGSNYVDVHVGHLREKLEADGGSRIVQTIRSFGYMLRQS